MTKTASYRTSRISLFLGGVALAAISSGAFAQGADENETGIQDIIVTAQKREQSLQDVPISVSAIGSQALETNRIRNFTDIGMLAPNLTIRDVLGSNGVPAIALRGAVVFGTLPGQDRAVSMYLDGVWIGAASGLAFELPDLERIEVLRGPQGTLFGRNSTGGAVSFTTREPAGELKFRSTASVGNLDQFRIATRVDTPAWGPFSASMSYTKDKRRGDVRNLGAGTTWDRSNSPNSGQGVATSPKWLGSKDADAIFVSVKFEPSDSFKTVYRYDWSKNWYTPEGVAVTQWNPERLGAFLGGAFSAMYEANPFPISRQSRPKAVNNWFVTPALNKASGHNLTSTWKASDSVTIKNILAYRDGSVFTNSDYGMGGLYNNSPVAAFLGTVDAPYVIFSSQTASNIKQWSDELQVNYDSQHLTLTVGGLYFRSNAQFGSPPNLGSPLFFLTVPDFELPVTPGEITFAKTKSLAGYAQAEVHVSEQIDLVGGYRVTQDVKDIESNLPGGIQYLSDYNKTRGSYHLGVNVKPRDGMLVYAKYSTAFVSGGEINTIEFAPETAESWEVGFKGDFFDRHLRTNIALFDVTYKNLQAAVTGTASDTDDIPADIPIAIATQGTVKAKGIEFEVTIAPVKGLTLNGGLGFTDYKLSSLNPIIGTPESFRLFQRSRWTATLSAAYESEPLFNDVRFVFNTDAAWRSRYRAASRLPIPVDYARYEFVKPEWVVNARAGLSGFDLGPVKLDAAIWARNLFDSGKPQFPISLFGSTNPFVTVSSFTKARTFGLDLTLSY